MVRTVPVHDAGAQRDLPVLQTFLQGHVQRFAVLHLDGGALLVGQIRPDGADERRRRFVAAAAPGVRRRLAGPVFLWMVHLIQQFLFLGLELVQLDGQFPVLGLVDRVFQVGEHAVQRVDVASGQPDHLLHVLQLVAQRRDFLEIERHDSTAGAAAATATATGLQAGRFTGPRKTGGLRGACATAAAPSRRTCRLRFRRPTDKRETPFFCWGRTTFHTGCDGVDDQR